MREDEARTEPYVATVARRWDRLVQPLSTVGKQSRIHVSSINQTIATYVLNLTTTPSNDI